MPRTLNELRRLSPFVEYCLHNGMTVEEVLIVQAAALIRLQEENLRMSLKTPRIYRGPSGKEVVYRCPDDLLDVVQLDSEPIQWKGPSCKQVWPRTQNKEAT